MENCKPSSLQVRWGDHHDLFITEMRNHSRRVRDLLRNDTDALAYALLNVLAYLTYIFTATVSSFGLLTVHKYLAHLGTDSQQQIEFQNLRHEVPTPCSAFNVEEQSMFNEIFSAYRTWCHVIQRYQHHPFSNFLSQ